MLDLENLTTEQRNLKTLHLDELSVREALQIMNAEDQQVAVAVQAALDQIEPVIEHIITAFQTGGRLIYMGAGTSGRLGVLDAAECVPTFGIDPAMVVGLIAGGSMAMITAVEGAEDSLTLGAQDLIDLHLTAQDVVVGIAASGRTPYVIGGLDYARKVGATTCSLAANQHAKISAHAQLPIEIDAGPEFLTGSTRLKAGTAQKLVLNMLSTIAMIGIGKVYQNLMVDVKPTNAKLVERAKRIIMAATDVDYATAQQAFMDADEQVKLAIVMLLTDLPKAQAQARLTEKRGIIKNVIDLEELQHD
ncbi:MAG: N-acetylmuramic acid 6-phosphate etherase [Lactobacillaceae bacterium]|jgi:N-acetylmuramic acid 6-phosphate etherase|nr:N-acetylmuramic acid 6-phosphate etherase [Lactobacillaceae bacterium]